MNWDNLSKNVLDGEKVSEENALAILHSPNSELLSLLQASYRIRHNFFSNKVSLHLLRNVKSGVCPEDCSFCSQSTKAINDVERYDMQTVEATFNGAKAAVDRNSKSIVLFQVHVSPFQKKLILFAKQLLRLKEYPKLENLFFLGMLRKSYTIKTSGC